MFQFFVPMNLREREHFVFRPFLKAQPSRQNPLYETFMLLFVVIAENSRKIARAKKVDASVGTVFQNDPSVIFESVVAFWL